MTGIDALARKKAAVTAGPDAGEQPGTSDPAGHAMLPRAFHSLITAPKQRLGRSQPSARDGVWVNAAQPPDDPETSWPSTVFNPFGSEAGEMVVPTGPPDVDLMPLPEPDGGYGCQHGLATPDSKRRLFARRPSGRHAAPSASVGSRLARKFAAYRRRSLVGADH